MRMKEKQVGSSHNYAASLHHCTLHHFTSGESPLPPLQVRKEQFKARIEAEREREDRAAQMAALEEEKKAAVHILTSPHPSPPHLTSPHPSPPHLTSPPHLASPHLTPHPSPGR